MGIYKSMLLSYLPSASGRRLHVNHSAAGGVRRALVRQARAFAIYDAENERSEADKLPQDWYTTEDERKRRLLGASTPILFYFVALNIYNLLLN